MLNSFSIRELIPRLLNSLSEVLDTPCADPPIIHNVNSISDVAGPYTEPARPEAFDGKQLNTSLSSSRLTTFGSTTDVDDRKVAELMYVLALQRVKAKGERALFLTGWPEYEYFEWLVSLSVDVGLSSLKRARLNDGHWDRMSELFLNSVFQSHRIARVKPFITCRDLEKLIGDVQCSGPLGLIVIDPIYVFVEGAQHGFWWLYEELDELAKRHHVTIWNRFVFDESEDVLDDPYDTTPRAYRDLVEQSPANGSQLIRLELSSPESGGRVAGHVELTTRRKGSARRSTYQIAYDFENRILSDHHAIIGIDRVAHPEKG